MRTSTSGGKCIAPQMLEGYWQDRFIEQVAIIADARKFGFRADRAV